MSTAAQSLGVNTAKYEFGGVTYTLSELDLQDYAGFELFVEETGWAALKRARHFRWITDAEYKEMVREWLSLLATFQLAFGSEAFGKATETLPGIQKMLEMGLKHAHPELDPKVPHDMVRQDLKGVLDAMARVSPNDAS